MIFKMKVAKKGAFMITITINLSSSKVRCGPSTIYWKLRQIFNQEIKLVVFPGLHIFSSLELAVVSLLVVDTFEGLEILLI